MEKRVGTFLVVFVSLSGSCLVVESGFIEVLGFLEQVVAEPEVCFEADLASWVAFDDGLPDLQCLFVFAQFDACVTGLQEFAGGAVLDDGAAFGGSRWPTSTPPSVTPWAST